MRIPRSVLDEIGVERKLSSKMFARILKYFGHIRRANMLEFVMVQGKVNRKKEQKKAPNKMV